MADLNFITSFEQLTELCANQQHVGVRWFDADHTDAGWFWTKAKINSVAKHPKKSETVANIDWVDRFLLCSMCGGHDRHFVGSWTLTIRAC